MSASPAPPPDPAAERDRLIDEALALPRSEHARFLAQQASVSRVVLDEVARALAEVDRDDGFLRPGSAIRAPIFDEWLHEAGRAHPALAEGARIGPYEVVGFLGAGGMGEVYRARDTRLGRDVALKVLPRSLRVDPERAARLRREARVLAALNHPHVAAVYDLAESDEALALVLELVRGETLATRLGRGPLPMGEVLSIARQLAEGIAAAHHLGIVHCDLKPGNVAFDRDGRVRILDFGIATATRGDADVTASQVPSITTSPVLSEGVIGTVRYMSPEQLRGAPLERQTDVWAFGCLCFEMVTGACAFDATTNVDVVARVLERDPPLDRLPVGTPLAWRALIARCLDKDPTTRLANIRDALPLIETASRQLAPGQVGVAPPGGATGVRARLADLRAAPVVVGLLLGGLGALGLVWLVRPQPAATIARLTVPVPSSDELTTGAQSSIAITPDGSRFVYRARRGGQLQLFQRALDQASPVAIPDTVNAIGPFVSPDGAWVGFSRDGQLLRAPLAGSGPLAPICACGGGGASSAWGDRGTVVFAPTPGDGLYRVPAAGGSPTPLTKIDVAAGERAHGFPHILPGERAVLFSVVTADASYVAVVDMASGQVRRLTDGRQPRYLTEGFLTWVRGNTLWAATFDADRQALTGEPRAVLPGLDLAPSAHVAVDRTGSLLYVPAPELVPPRRLVWIDRAGRETPLNAEPRRYQRASLSPDGRRVAVVIADDAGQDIWVQDLAQQTRTRVTFAADNDTAPVWTPDGRSLIFRSESGSGGIYQASAHGGERARLLLDAVAGIQTPYAVTPDGATLLYTEFRTYRDQGIGGLSLRGVTPSSRLILDGPGAETRPALSPDGRWLAYQDDVSGRFEVYVRPYPGVERAVWQVSTAGGMSPQFSADGRELFYFDGRMMVRVAVGDGEAPLTGRPEPMFAADAYGSRLGPLYAVSPDAQRFLFVQDDDARGSVAARRQLVLVQHWTTELRALFEGTR